MAMPSTKFILLNATACLVAIGALVGVVRSWASLRSCSERYEVTMTFPLVRDGATIRRLSMLVSVAGSSRSLHC